MAFPICARRGRSVFASISAAGCRQPAIALARPFAARPSLHHIALSRALARDVSSRLSFAGVVVMRTADLVAEYVESRRRSGINLARPTVRAYFDSARYAGEWYPPSPERVKTSLQALLQLAPQSEKSHIQRLKTLAGYAAAAHGIPDPFEGVTARRATKLPHRVFSSGEYTQLRSACRDSIDSALLDLLMGTGIRIGEAPLHINQVSEIHRITSPDGKAHEVAYLAVSGKTGQRYVPITVRERAAVMATASAGRLWVSTAAPNKPPTPLGYWGLVTRWRRLVERAGLTGRKLGPHTARHTFASTWVMSGGGIESLQPILGHQSISTTEIYVHRLPGFVAAQLLRHDPLGAIRHAAQTTSGPEAA